MNNSYRTAIQRNKISAPMNMLLNMGSKSWSPLSRSLMMLTKPTALKLDYGCGRGYDADALGMDKFDPHFSPKLNKGMKYDIITCNYVMNVIPSSKKRAELVETLKSLLARGGKAYISVRRDIKGQGYRGKGKSRTWQGNIRKIPGAISIYKCSGFEIYEVQ